MDVMLTLDGMPVRVLHLRRTDAGWEISRWNLRGALVNTGFIFTDVGLSAVLSFYDGVRSVPLGDRKLSAFFRRASLL